MTDNHEPVNSGIINAAGGSIPRFVHTRLPMEELCRRPRLTGNTWPAHQPVHGGTLPAPTRKTVTLGGAPGFVHQTVNRGTVAVAAPHKIASQPTEELRCPLTLSRQHDLGCGEAASFQRTSLPTYECCSCKPSTGIQPRILGDRGQLLNASHQKQDLELPYRLMIQPQFYALMATMVNKSPRLSAATCAVTARKNGRPRPRIIEDRSAAVVRNKTCNGKKTGFKPPQDIIKSKNLS
jgi:hypothetical protein